MDEAGIAKQRRDSDEKSTRERASILGLQYLDTRTIESTLPLCGGVLTIDDMHKGRLVPLVSDEKGGHSFGVTTNTPQSIMRALEKKYRDDGSAIAFLLISDSGYRVLMQRYDPPRRVQYDDITLSNEGSESTLEQVSNMLRTVRSDALLDYLIDQADKLRASDIHIENQNDAIRIRMRVDGTLHPVAMLEREKYRALMASLASRADISSAAAAPQSGHLQKEISRAGETPKLLSMRVETIPTQYGQDAVLRLFSFEERLLTLDSLQLTGSQRSQIDEIIGHPRGMVMVVGPTGSGKSTTLYSMLHSLNTIERKIITLEDPIEYSMSGVSQIPVNTTNGQSFAEDLRSVLRLDPDVVMIGEIRDQDTARTAIQASITGHLVLTSFHASSASAAFSRMIDLIGVNPIFSSAIRLVIAQRLVRQLHSATKQAYDPDDATKKYLQNIIDTLPPGVEKPDVRSAQLWRPVPTSDVPFGYSGRIVLMEQLVVTESVQKFIRGDIEDIRQEDIEKQAVHEGMTTLLQSGVLAALRGDTSLEEVMRVV